MYQFIHSTQTSRDRRQLNKRLLDPAAQHPLAHRCTCTIQHAQQRSTLLLRTHGFQQFQIAAGRQVQLHEGALLVVIQIVDVGEIRFLGLV